MRGHPAIALAVLLVGCAGGRVAPEAPGPAAEPAPNADARPADAPSPAPEVPAGLMASARVDTARSELVPASVEVTRGDTVVVKGVLRDSAGARVEGARWALFTQSGLLRVQAAGDSLPDAYLVWGVQPGEAVLRAVLILPGDEGPRFELFGSVPVRVRDWPAARIDLEPPAYGTYVGSTFALSGHVITTHETEHATARITWSSSDPDVVSITPSGVATFRRPGRAVITAESQGVSATTEIEVRPSPVRSVTLSAPVAEARTGDVVHLAVDVRGRRGRPVPDAHVAYSVSAVAGPADGAAVFPDGAFVAAKPGVYRVIAFAGGATGSAVITARPRHDRREVRLVGRGAVAHVATSDLWVFEGRDGRDYAYTGTHAEGGGQRLFVWDVTDPGSPVLTDSVVVDARVVNDVKVNADATIAVITREGASNRKNGIVILDIRNPAHPVVLSQLTKDLTGGIHNTWINGDVVYAVNDGTAAMHIIDISDPANPKQVGRWEWRPGDRNKYLHDVWVKDGLAYLSYWDDGLIILDVGAGIKGGTPRAPKFVSQYKYPIGNTHTAFRYRDYVFVGDEIFGCEECTNGPRGYVHVIDVSDIEHPREVARYEVPEAGAHNIWVEDDVLYVAYYQGGLRVVDVSGELRGDLYAQGRQLAHFHTAGRPGEALHPNSPMAWGPQPFKGLIYVSDLNSGLWVVRLMPPKKRVLP